MRLRLRLSGVSAAGDERMRLGKDGSACMRVQDEGKVDGGNGDEMGRVDETEVGAVRIIDDEPGSDA